jgi:hypothetical protein
MYTDISSLRRSYFFIGIVILAVVLNYLVQSTLITESVFINTYTETMDSDRISELFRNMKHYQLIAYVLVPVLLIIKVGFNTFALTVRTLLSEGEFSFHGNFNVCLKAELAFTAMLLVKTIWLLFFSKVETVGDINFIPLSAAGLWHAKNLPKWAVYPLETLNLWELAYCYIGSMLFATQYKLSMKKAAGIFCSGYLGGTLVIIIISIFLAITFS